MSDPRQKTDMSDELTTIARKSYGESAIFVKCTSGSPKFWFYLGRRLVSEHDAASHAEAFRELKLKLETMAMFTELQDAKVKAKDAAETKRMVDEFAAQVRRVYGPTAETEFDPQERTFGVLVDGVRVIEERGATAHDASERAMARLDHAAYNQITPTMRVEFTDLAQRLYPGSIVGSNTREFEFYVRQRFDGTPIVSETGATMLDAYNAVMARLRAVSVKAEEPDAPALTPEIGEAFVKFNALPALVTDVFGDDAQVIVHPQQPYVTIESRIGRHTVFASSASATTQQAVSAAHAWLTAMKTDVPSLSRIDAEVLRAFGPKVRFAPNGNAGYAAVREGDAELLVWNDSNFDKLLRRAIAYLLCLPSKTVAASEATAAPERTTGVSNEATVEELKEQLRVEAMRAGGPTTALETGASNGVYYAKLTIGEGASWKEIAETRRSERLVYELMLDRLRAMPTFVPPAASVLSDFNKAVAVEMKTRLPDAPPAAPAITFANDYANWGHRDVIGIAVGPAPINLSITNTTPEQKATPTMTPPTPTAPTIAQTLAADADAAAWRLAGSQFVKLAKEPLVALLSRNLGPGDESLRARIAAFLDTELGFAIVTALLAAGLSAVPAPPGSKAATINAKLARELRVNSMAVAADALADVLAGPMRQVIAMYLSGDPSSLMGLPDGADRIVVPSTVATAAEVTR